MSRNEHWGKIRSHIVGLRNSAAVYADFNAGSKNDMFGSHKILGKHCQEIWEIIKKFMENHQVDIPQSAAERIQKFDVTLINSLSDETNREVYAQAMRSAVIGLISLEATISFLLEDEQENIRRRSELAFTHLQRSIAVDETIRKKWDKAFCEGEVNCEKLGAIFLLQHGIFAFKINSEGARTDLVYAEVNLNKETENVGGLIVTEWKKISENKEAKAKFREAVEQLKAYSEGPLSGLELRSRRYVILLSETELSGAQKPDDIVDESGLLIRCINLSINPETPSRAAKIRARD